jgi:chromosome segregation ATPase
MFDENEYISEEINNDIESDNIFYSKMIDEFGEILKFLRNENFMLKTTIEEKSQILQNFQNVTQEAKKKIDKLIEDNENLLNENKQMKEQLKKLNEQKKEEEKKENMQMKNELCSLKNELNTVQNYFTNQLKRKECCINDLKKNYDNLESQYQQTLKQTLNNCSNSQNNTYGCNNSYINNCNNSYIPNNNMNRTNLDFNKNYNCSNIIPKCINDLNNCG